MEDRLLAIERQRLLQAAVRQRLAFRMKHTPMGLELGLAAAWFDCERGTAGLTPAAFPMVSRLALGRAALAAEHHARTMPARGAGEQGNVA